MDNSSRRFRFPRFQIGRKAPFPSNRVPIHERELAINPQSNSPLYNGRVPAEIRNTIFDYALTEYTKTDDGLPPGIVTFQYPKNTHFTRPGYKGKKTMNVALLQICRRTYLETYHLPLANKELVFWHARGPPAHSGSTLVQYGEQEIRFFEQFAPWQMALIKEIHMFVQAFWLETVFSGLAKQDFMQGLENIKITLRRGDWWNWESNNLLGISPQSGSGDSGVMHREWALERQGGTVPWKRESWGRSFADMKRLKQLEMEFETSDDKREELKAIVQKAITWKFPAYSKESSVELVLSADGYEPKWHAWFSPMCYWSDNCPYCGQRRTCTVVDPPNKGCVERARLMKEKTGPLCHMVSLTWKVSRKYERD